MAKAVVINVDVETKKALKDVGDLNDEMQVTVNTLGDMREASALLEEELEGVEVGTDRYKELRKELIKVNTEIKNQELAMEALDNEQVASELKSVAGGLTDMAGGFALVGVANESMEKVVQTMAQVEGMTKIVTGAIEGYSSAMKLTSTITTTFGKAVTFLSNSKAVLAVKTAAVTAAQWLWNVAVSANPIGIIVLAVAGLIAGIVALIMNFKKVIAWLKKMAVAFLALLGPIGAVIAGIKIFNDSQKSSADVAAKVEKALKELYESRIDTINKVIAAERKAQAERNKLNEQALALLKSRGEATEAAERKLVTDALNSSKIIVDAEKQKTKLQLDEYNRRLGTDFATNEQLIKHLEDKIKREDKLFKHRDIAEVKLLKARLENQTKAIDESIAAQVQYNEFETGLRQKSADAWKKAAEERRKAEEEFLKRSTEAWQKYDELQIDRMEEGTEKEIAILQMKFDERVKELDENIPAEQELIKAYEEQLILDMAEIQRKAEEEEYKNRRDQAIRLNELETELLNAQVEANKQAYDDDKANLDKQLDDKELSYSEYIDKLNKLNESQVADQAALENKQYSDSLNKLKVDLEDKKITLEEYQTQELILAQEHQNKLDQIHKDGTDKIVDSVATRVGIWQEKNAEVIAQIQDSFEVASAAITGIMDLVSQGLEERAAREQEARERGFTREEEALKASLANREIDQKQFDAKVKLLEQKRRNEELKAKRKAFNQNKGLQIVNAIMGTAQAVISGLSAPFPLGIAMAAINGALGAAQIGIIASQKFRAAKGGVVPGAPSNVDSVDAMLAPGETVINSESSQMFPQLLSAINQAGGGVSLAPDVPASGNTGGGDSNTFEQNRSNQTPMVKAVVVESDITETQNKVNRIKERNTFG